MNDDTLALVDAVRDGDILKVMTLINQWADINVKDQNGWTPLHHAATDRVKLRQRLNEQFLCTSQDLDVLTDDLANRKKSIAQLLLNHHAIVDAKDDVGATPLIRATNAGDVQVAELLIKHGAQQPPCP